MLLAGALALAGSAGAPAAAGAAFPRYDHVFLLIEENHDFSQIIGNPDAPVINALAGDYGLATNYTGVADPSEPNYVAMLGGSAFGIKDDEPYFFPGHTVNRPNLMSQLQGAGLSWKGYFQGMPYPGYRGYCFPAKCNGIPDSDTQYVAKHDGIVNYAAMQTAEEFARLDPYQQLSRDLASGQVPNLSYIVPDECHDMHGAPPWCVDSGEPGTIDDDFLVAAGDAFARQTVEQIMGSAVWKHGNNAIVLTFDEGEFAGDRVPAIVITSHGPRGVTDATPSNHYSLLASLQDAFGLGCLLKSCSAAPLTALFSTTGPSSAPALPPALVPAPDGTDTVSPTGAPAPGASASLSHSNAWQLVPSPSIGTLDNNLAAVSAASAQDAWAVGNFYRPGNPEVLQTLGLHWNGSDWTAYPLPDVGPNENTLLGVSELHGGSTYAVGYFVDAHFRQRTLIEHYDGTAWHVVPSPDPGSDGDILYGVAALGDSDVWAVGAQRSSDEVWHPLAEHWDGSSWSVVPTPDPGGGGNLLYAVAADAPKGVYAAGQGSAEAFPSPALVEHWNGAAWSIVPSAGDPTESLDPFGLTVAEEALTVVGARESDTAPFTTLVGAGSASSLGLVNTPSRPGENDLFAASTAANGSTWAVGWFRDPTSETHRTLVEHGVHGHWSLVASPNPSAEENGFAGVTAIPGGGLWAVGITTNAEGNPATLVEFHP
jgi:hypothetical protein